MSWQTGWVSIPFLLFTGRHENRTLYNKTQGMKRQELESIVNKHVHRIEKYAEHLPGTFEEEDIHDLRVNYKKLRAFLRLLEVQDDAGDLELPDALKVVYHSCGGVRDVQLFLASLKQQQGASSMPCFINNFQQKLFANKEQTVKSIEAIHFKKMLAAIKKELPHHLRKSTVHQFIQQKIAAMHILLLVADSDNNLHSIRKNSKDIIYNLRILKQDAGIDFTVMDMPNEELLDDMATRLGDYNDRCLAVSLLQSGYDKNCNQEEQAFVNNLLQEQLQQKESEKQKLLQQVQQLRMQYA